MQLNLYSWMFSACFSIILKMHSVDGFPWNGSTAGILISEITSNTVFILQLSIIISIH